MPLFTIIAHDYLIIRQTVGRLSININREMRQKPFTNMKQPIQHGCMMGMDVIMNLKIMGKPAIGYKWILSKDGDIIQTGITDNQGISEGIDLDFSNGICQCDPTQFRNDSDDVSHCNAALATYKLEVSLPEN